MIKISVAFVMLCTAGICAAQSAVTIPQPAQSAPKHFRLTFVLSYPQSQQPSQSFVLDIPVAHERPGTSDMSLTSGLTGQMEDAVAEKIQCTDVQESATGLSAKVRFAMDSVTAASQSSSSEPLHHNVTFDRKIDLVLGKPQRITEEMQVRPLRNGDAAMPNMSVAPPQISVTAVEL